MGSDNLFKKRKARKAESLKRTRAKRDSYATVLIVCEGEKTEPNYFTELRDDLKLNTANIRITGDTDGSSPMDVVNYGFKHFKEYDRTFCVFDKDRHTNYQQALNKIRDKKQPKVHVLQAITSVPCFEFWLLLHFRKTTKNFDTGPGSICDRVISKLEAYLPGYAKGRKGIYRQTKEKLDTAIKNAAEVAAHCKNAGTDHPSTQIHELIVFLQKLRSDK
ncbi:MAG: RloB family protein [Pseudomonadota bacterium]|nr:RloB family protein [Pseudomonadota bacterium]